MEMSQSPLSIHVIRRTNLLTLLRVFSEQRIAAGDSAKGIEGAFAAHIGVSAVTLSHLKTRRNVSDKMALQIESACAKAPGWLGWLSGARRDSLSGPAELFFLDRARVAWRQGNAKEKRRLMKLAKNDFELEQLLIA